MRVSVNAACRSRKNVELADSSSFGAGAVTFSLSLQSAATTFLRDFFFAVTCGAASALFVGTFLPPDVSIVAAAFLALLFTEDGGLAFALAVCALGRFDDTPSSSDVLRLGETNSSGERAESRTLRTRP